MVLPGIETLLNGKDDLVRNRSYALICHGASIDSTGHQVFERLCRSPDTRPAGLWVPEHGLCGEQAYMEPVPDSVDPALSVPIVSLYGESMESLSPDLELLSTVDAVLFDLQDVGARYYTYLATMAMTMEACAKTGVQFIVADRPNPLGGLGVEGNRVRTHLRSFVGYLSLANRHGMTAAEAARLHASDRRLDLDLKILQCKGLNRAAYWPDMGLPFVPPSPNIPDWLTALVYPGMCLLEGTNLSEGRGTTTPFLLFGAPYITDPRRLAARLEGFQLAGVAFLPTWFTPLADKWAGQRCGGIRLVVTDNRTFRPLLSGITILSVCAGLYRSEFQFREEAYEFVDDHLAIDLLLGDEAVRKTLEEGTDPRDIASFMESETIDFLDSRGPYLLY